MLAGLLLFIALGPDLEVGQNLTPAAQVAGPWEALVAPGKVAGFALLIITGANQKVRLLRVDTYVRKGGHTSRTWWSNGDPSGAFVLRAGHLQFHQTRRTNTGFDVALDLTYDSIGSAWKGSFRDPFYSGQVVLRRPSMSSAVAPAGTWRTYSDAAIWPTGRVDDYGCLNMGVGQDGALVLWAEHHNVFLSYDEAKRPVFGDSYGELEDDSQATRYVDEWSFTDGNGMGGEHVTGAMSSDGSAFGGYSEHYGDGESDPSHPKRAFAWKRMLDLVCRP